MMKVTKTPINGLVLLEPEVFEDHRGYFFESYNKQKYPHEITSIEWVQDNESKSRKGVLRGLHYQFGMMAQSKMVRVITGSIYDIAVDIRKDSPTFGRWFGVLLNDKNKKQFFIPRGFAHGFLVLEDNTIFSYKCDNFYAPDFEGGIHWNDPDLAIDWPLPKDEIIISKKDEALPNLTLLTPQHS